MDKDRLDGRLEKYWVCIFGVVNDSFADSII